MNELTNYDKYKQEVLEQVDYLHKRTSVLIELLNRLEEPLYDLAEELIVSGDKDKAILGKTLEVALDQDGWTLNKKDFEVDYLWRVERHLQDPDFNLLETGIYRL